MLNTLNFQRFFRSRTAAGVEVIIGDNGIAGINLVVVALNKSALTIETARIGVKDIPSLRPLMPSHIPVNLVISGRGIMHKLLEGSDDPDDAALLQQALPNAQPDEFYMEKEPAAGSGSNQILLSIIRKNRAHEIVGEFGNNGIYVVSASLGPFCVRSILPLLNGNSHEGQFEINLSGRWLCYSKSMIREFNVSNFSGNGSRIAVGTESMDERSVVPFAAAFQYFFSQAERTATKVPVIKNAQAEVAGRRMFRILAATTLVFYFVFLVVNFFVFTYLSGKFNELESSVSQNREILTGYEKLKSELAEKRRFLHNTGLLEPSLASFYADRLAAGMPTGIRLEGISINPPLKKPGDDKTIAFNMNFIRISGECNETSTLNNWVHYIKEQQWVKEVTIADYSKKVPSAPAEFRLEISAK